MVLECLTYINDYRVNTLGIHALTINEDAMIGAKIRAAEIAYKFSHKRPNTPKIWAEYFNRENIAEGQKTGQKAFDDWFNSLGHRDNFSFAMDKSTGISAFYCSEIENMEMDTFSYKMYWVNGFR